MNNLCTAVTDYISMRRQLGYKMRNEAFVLNRFAKFMMQKKKNTIKTRLVLEFASQSQKPGISLWSAKVIGIIRRFAIYLHAINGKSEIPPTNLLPHSVLRKTPYIFSENEIVALLEAVNQICRLIL
ncbi:MAG: hypothetical protein H0W50_07940 [Parachlamydiaceae bacterium]|nr:hypothetical protein [Parachlamydiaceae bacterium]